MRDYDVIAAVSTAAPAAIAVIRVSGQGCLPLLRPFLSKDLVPRQMTFSRIKQDGELLDEALVVFFPGPNSYTGEDMMELHVHGGPYIVQRCMQLLYDVGMRAAEPGEFTRRAFLNQKMDLTYAEGVRTLVSAQSRQEWVAAKGLLDGRLSRLVSELRGQLIKSMAHIEARIDFPDEAEPSAVTLHEVLDELSVCRLKIENLLTSYDSGRIASQGLRVALVGPPNAGKSTLLNELLGVERALVTNIPGTTRDFLEESCLLEGRMIRLCDTAGLRETKDPIEKLGIEKSIEICKQADVVLLLEPVDAPKGVVEFARQSLEGTNLLQKCLTIPTKTDLSINSKTEGGISCHTGNGLDLFKKDLIGKVDKSVRPLEEEAPFITCERHKSALKSSLEALDRCHEAAMQGAYDEMIAFELLEATRSLATVLGAVDTEDILDVVFSSFCIGK
ncbi:MAG: tRNA uridine-5-carboxymethylaminomethyl(34) synthesis GTPase MnmE [Oligoflexales bacterium]